MDLAQMDNIARYNKGVHFLLVVVDTLSSFLWVEPVKRKTGVLVTEAFKRILERATPRKPKMVFTDKGLEFYNRNLIDLLDSLHVTLYSTTTSSIKASQAERKIRTLKGRLYKMMTHQRSWKYLEQLQDVVDGINNSVNRTIGMKPAAVGDDQVQQVFRKRYTRPVETKKPSFAKGDYVRTREQSGLFKKEFRPSYSKSIYRVENVKNTSPTMYELGLVDANGVDITQVNRAYYSPELVQVKPDFTHKEFPDPPKLKRRI